MGTAAESGERPFDTLLRRVEAAGIWFINRPTQLHHQRHGHLSDTFFVYDAGSRRKRLNTEVEWAYRTDAGYIATGPEIAISKWSTTSMRRFVRGQLYIIRSDFSGCGVGLMVCEGKPKQDEHFDLVAVCS